MNKEFTGWVRWPTRDTLQVKNKQKHADKQKKENTQREACKFKTKTQKLLGGEDKITADQVDAGSCLAHNEAINLLAGLIYKLLDVSIPRMLTAFREAV